MEWYLESGPESDVVFSSRVRLARNLKNYPFPARMDEILSHKMIDDIREVVDRSDKKGEYGFVFYDMKALDQVERQVLVEKHLISPDLAEQKRESGVLVSRDGKISVMLNEEDHLRIQCLFPGMQLEKAAQLCNRIDDMFDNNFEYAYSTEFGYLTCCPTNVGTGIRASLMLHLPAITMSGLIDKILEACSKLGLAVRGMYGENTKATGNLYQISNQVTLGQNEEEILSSVKNIVFQIIDRERVLRNEMYGKDKQRFEDRIFRAYGVLTNARMISTEESLHLLSNVRMGINVGIIKDISIEKINELMIIVQPAFLRKAIGKDSGPEERDAERARLLREKLGAR
jgi:protein arginine kinase